MNIMTTVFFICAYIQMENSIRYQSVGFLKESIIFAVIALLSSTMNTVRNKTFKFDFIHEIIYTLCRCLDIILFS